MNTNESVAKSLAYLTAFYLAPVTLILLANSVGLSSRFPLADGDVTVSPFARAFIEAAR